MGILIGFIRQIVSWDMASKVALLLDLVLLVAACIILLIFPDMRSYLLISVAGLVIALQFIILWGNRNMITPYTQAQRYFIDGEFALARDILRAYVDEQNAAHKRPSIDALVLLGNAYRNLSQLRESESILRLALAQRPNYHFALYGLGKIRLAMGDYGEAIKHFNNAVAHGAPAVVQFDLALAHYFRGDSEQAMDLLERLTGVEEVYRQVMIRHLLRSRYPDAQQLDSDLLREGMIFWEAELQRVGDTSYGRDLIRELNALR